MSSIESEVRWLCRPFAQLSSTDLYEILAVRQAVFVVEQNCRYVDADGRDDAALHVCGYLSNGGQRALAAYLRILGPGARYAEVSIGRVLTTLAGRGQGLGKALMANGIASARQAYPQMPIRISAQAYLESFYQNFGFVSLGKPYDEEGIVHIQMLLPW